MPAQIPRRLRFPWSESRCGGLAGACLAVLGVGIAGATEPLRPIAEILDLPLAELQAEPSARVRGVVTLARGNYVVEDDSGGIFVHRAEVGAVAGQPPRPVELGDVVELVGIVQPGAYAPNLVARKVVIVGGGPLAAAPPGELGRIFTGVDSGRRVEVRGVVQRILVRERGDTWPLVVAIDARRLLAILPRQCFPERPDSLVDADLRISGVVGTFRNRRGEFIAPLITVARPEDVVVVSPAPADPFAGESLPLAAIARFRTRPQRGHRLRTSGTVSAVLADRLYLANGDAGVRVDLADGQVVAGIEPGDRVEAAGFLDMGRRIGGLAAAVIRPLDRGVPPAPVRFEPAALASTDGASRSVPAGSEDGRLVTCRATVTDVARAAGRSILSLSADHAAFTAVLPAGPAADPGAVLPGAEVEVTGILQLELSAPGEGDQISLEPRLERFSILCRGPADIVILRRPPWWTPARLAAFLGGSGLLLAGALGWVVLLRRQVRVQSRQLAAEIRSRRDAALEFEATLKERNRLAANLHDTLLQTLGGIGYQLDACEGSRTRDEAEAKTHFDVARRMVGHAVSELHNSVWTMRSLPIRDQSFPDALRTITDRVGEGHAVRIDVRSSGDLADVPEFVGGHVLLIVQEALYNALRHGRPEAVEIRVHGDAATRGIDVVVQDDGCGFDTAAGSLVDRGHFGLQGMRERAERLGGWLEVESRPGQGTVVHARVLRHEYDATLAESAPGPA